MNYRTVRDTGNASPYLQSPRKMVSAGATAADEYERISSALQFIPVGGHDQRVRVALMLQSALGDDGRTLWDDWRDGRGDDEANAVWRSASKPGPLTIASLFHEAKANGWRDDGQYRRPSPAETAERKRVAAERAAKQMKIVERKRAAAEEKARQEWAAAAPAYRHPYLTKKGVKAHGARIMKDVLLIPLHDIFGVVHSLQKIHPDGTKKFLEGAPVRGHFHMIGKPGDMLIVAEGYATCATVHEATGHAVAVAISAGNLAPVAIAMRSQYPDIRIVVAADDDHRTEGNPGLTKAKEAARLVGGLLAVPKFGEDRPDGAKDFNDLQAQKGLDAVRASIAAARPPDDDEVTEADNPASESAQAADSALAEQYAREVILTRASELTPEPIVWIWNGWLAAGKMHVLGGAPGTGKTTIGMALAATVSTGGRWPDRTRSITGSVVVWSGEDDPADTLVPRLALSGADLHRIYFIADILECGERRSFDPARDLEPLRRKLAEIGDVKLLVVDPIVSAIAADSHKNSDVRRGLQPLVDMAAAMGCAVLGITHFSKGTGGRDPVERLTGSLAFGALARVVLVAAKHQEEGDDGRSVRLFCRAKSNLGSDSGGFEYDLHQAELKTHPGIFASSVLWGNAVEGAARELLATADATVDDGEGGTLGDAKRFLADLLADGPLPTKTIKADADGAGYSWATIRRAQKALGIEPVKEGMKSGWVWRMPIQKPEEASPGGSKMLRNTEDAQQKEMSNFEKIEHLRNDPGSVEVEI